MKQKVFNLVMALAFILTLSGVSIQNVSADTTKTVIDVSYPGAIQCGTLKGWGPWRSTENIALTNRTIFFEPKRTGTHKLQFYPLGKWAEGVMTPYWSNDNGGTWTSWSRVGYGDETKTIDLRTDTVKTIYKFVFYSASPSKKVIWYRFYCR